MSEPNVPPPPSYTPPPPPSGYPPPGGPANSNRTLMIVLAYLGPLALIPFLMEKEDREVQWHAKHGLVQFAVWVVVLVVSMILAQIPVLGCITVIVMPLLGLAYLIVAILCIVKGINGQRFIIPGLSQYADRF